MAVVVSVVDSLPWNVDGTLPASHSLVFVNGSAQWAVERTAATFEDERFGVPGGSVTIVVAAWDREPALAQSGNATCQGIGVVAGVEVSLNGGQRWHPAVRSNARHHADPAVPARGLASTATMWEYTWGSNLHDWMYDDPTSFTLSDAEYTPDSTWQRHVVAVARAVDDSLNLQTSTSPL